MTGAPPSPRAHRLPVAGGDLAWFEWGERSAAPSLLLVHATGFHARVWDRVVAALPARTHVIAPDLRGHGRSYHPASLSDWPATAADVACLIDAVGGGPIVAAGHSMGATILPWVAAARPGRIGVLALFDPVILPAAIYGGIVAGDPADHPVARRRAHWDTVEAMIARFADRSPYADWAAGVLDDYCRHGLIPAPDGPGFTLACPPLIEASAYVGALAADPYPAIRAVTAPTIVVRARRGAWTGPTDFSTSPTDPALAVAFADGRDLAWDDLSHFIPMQAPARVASLLNSALSML